MGEVSKIQWCHATFNPWWGCERVGPECDNCYAEAFSHRLGNDLWGNGKARRMFPDSHWNGPVKWNRAAEKAGERRRVFCASMADVLEDRRDLDPLRKRLWRLIEDTPNLDWMLLSKRPAKFGTLTPQAWREGDWPTNAWAGCTAGTQKTANVFIPQLVAAARHAPVRFVSAEPLLEEVVFRHLLAGVNLLILGGESGHGARELDIQWIRSARNAATAVGCAVFVKQMGAKPFDSYSLGSEQYDLLLKDKKGGDMSEWPEDLRVREMPA